MLSFLPSGHWTQTVRRKKKQRKIIISFEVMENLWIKSKIKHITGRYFVVVIVTMQAKLEATYTQYLAIREIKANGDS